ncbi:MAG: bifunctional diaminohydroxyphosphoribosylaminopyrimidine deaminase/5-amino-6-(5-phosphoribosylamino)uracil reductase RibD [Proteobacteria bacterium]|nr:MAG: bifunctional diaminohydroxyphosphoribosylaminopyrimidine deaminase/5-amino-6-(5-phosphoribosylamino)uracil reductase RibD [Pseudomonadota bacterium]
MRRAVALAANSLYLSDPNPRVGCVIAREGRIVSEGWTQRAGGAHAEIHALEQAGDLARGADVYVSLEPCSHTGRTGPCTQALIGAGVRRVFAAMIDPNPKVGGEGIATLRAAGVEVHVGLCEDEASRLNPGFIRRMNGGLPWVRVKLGASVDGRTAIAGGESQWITSAEARQDVQQWRARSSAVLTGIGTVLADDPSMNVRLEQAGFQPLRVVLDSSRRIDPRAKIFSSEGRVLVVSTTRGADDGIDTLVLPERHGRVPLEPLLRALAENFDCNEVLVEAGASLSGAFVRDRLVDEFVFYLAPSLIGDEGRGMFALGKFSALTDAVRLEFTHIDRVGADLRIIARPAPNEE